MKCTWSQLFCRRNGIVVLGFQSAIRHAHNILIIRKFVSFHEFFQFRKNRSHLEPGQRIWSQVSSNSGCHPKCRLWTTTSPTIFAIRVCIARQMTGWKTKNNNSSTMKSELWRNAGPNAFQLYETILKRNKIWCAYPVVKCVYCQSTNILNAPRISGCQLFTILYSLLAVISIVMKKRTNMQYSIWRLRSWLPGQTPLSKMTYHLSFVKWDVKLCCLIHSNIGLFLTYWSNLGWMLLRLLLPYRSWRLKLKYDVLKWSYYCNCKVLSCDFWNEMILVIVKMSRWYYWMTDIGNCNSMPDIHVTKYFK